MENEEPEEERSVIQERLNWQVAWRDDEKVAQALYAGEIIDEMHDLGDAGLIDEFFVFLKELGMLEAFEQVSRAGVKRTLIPTVQLVLLYFLKVLVGGQSMNELPRVWFSDLALMFRGRLIFPQFIEHTIQFRVHCSCTLFLRNKHILIFSSSLIEVGYAGQRSLIRLRG